MSKPAFFKPEASSSTLSRGHSSASNLDISLNALTQLKGSVDKLHARNPNADLSKASKSLGEVIGTINNESLTETATTGMSKGSSS